MSPSDVGHYVPFLPLVIEAARRTRTLLPESRSLAAKPWVPVEEEADPPNPTETLGIDHVVATHKIAIAIHEKLNNIRTKRTECQRHVAANTRVVR